MLARAREFLDKKQLPQARLEAELLVAHALGLDRLQLFLALDRPLVPAEIERARELLQRRARREPTAYLTGRREFYGREFAVDRRVLIPRPETELLIDLAREWHARREADSEPVRVLDCGTGSGCLAITAALELEASRVVAVDVSREALEVARVNAERLGAAVELVAADGPEELAGAFDLILANPPYVTVEETAALDPEVREHEPAVALFAPPGDPDHWLQRLVRFAAERLAPGGLALVEIGASQAPRAPALAAEAGLDARLSPDLAGIPRVLACARRGDPGHRPGSPENARRSSPA
jgi:release factor glutamine methyltransferase